jgi:hypothetical protein
MKRLGREQTMDQSETTSEQFSRFRLALHGS